MSLVVLRRESMCISRTFSSLPIFVSIQSRRCRARSVCRGTADDAHDFLGQIHVLGFFRIDAKHMCNAGRPNLAARFGLVLGELAKIIVEALHGTAIEPGPERRFATLPHNPP